MEFQRCDVAVIGFPSVMSQLKPGSVLDLLVVGNPTGWTQEKGFLHVW